MLGRSEEIVGAAIKGKRSSFIIATKVGLHTGSGGIGPAAEGKEPNASGLSRKHILDAIEDSLRRLQTDYIDLYYCHFPDFDTPLDETLHVFDDLIRDGKIRYIGCSNFSAWRLCKALSLSDCHNLHRFECIQSPYNLITRDIEMELIPFCAEEKVGITVFNPLAGEMLTGRHELGKEPAEGRFTEDGIGKAYLERYWNKKNFDAVDVLKDLANERGCTLVQFSLAWILNNEKITSLLTGVKSVDQLKENLVATEIKLTPDELKVCDDVWGSFRTPQFHYALEKNIRNN
jgi:aryl-alcohol dehydrogenase-like predicted oxidoreductase